MWYSSVKMQQNVLCKCSFIRSTFLTQISFLATFSRSFESVLCQITVLSKIMLIVHLYYKTYTIKLKETRCQVHRGCFHCVKSVQIRSFSGPYSPVFGLNTERYQYLSVFSLNVGKFGLEKTLYLNTFHAMLVSCLTFIILQNFLHNHTQQFLLGENIGKQKYFRLGKTKMARL